MWNKERIKTLSDKAIKLLKEQGKKCLYGEIRFVNQEKRNISSQNGNCSTGSDTEKGYGIRVLTEGTNSRQGWGFASTSILDDETLLKIVNEAVLNGEANQLFQPKDTTTVKFEGSTEIGTYATPVEIDPFHIPLSELGKRVLTMEEKVKGERAISTSAFISADRQDKYFFNTTGANIHQTITYIGGSVTVMVSSKEGNHNQSCSYPAPAGNFNTAGLEHIDNMNIEKNAETLYDTACEICDSPECEEGIKTVVIGPQMLALLVHEVAGHALELDRALGQEAAYAGRSFLKTDEMTKLVYGADIVNIVSDTTYEGAVSTYGWDDEGTKSRKVYMIKDGIHVNYLSGRGNAHLLGLKSAGACRSIGWHRQPIDRITNVNLLPGDKLTAEEIIASVDDGLYLNIPCGWSINSDRNGFRFSVERCREIKNGKLGKYLRNGAFSAETTPEFWAKCISIAKDKPANLGFANCAKGQPVQVQYTGHVVPQAVRFDNVNTGEASNE